MKALCLVAHPDDCVLFGYKFITDHPHWDWHIWYLTYTSDSDRVEEMRKFWNKRNVKVCSGGFVDDWKHVSVGQLGFDKDHAKTCITGASNGYDILLSHNAVGEYKHPHHLFIHEVVKNISIPKVYFGTFPHHCNHIIKTETVAFNSDELPIHKSVIDDFDLTSWKYLITPEAENLVNYTHE